MQSHLLLTVSASLIFLLLKPVISAPPSFSQQRSNDQSAIHHSAASSPSNLNHLEPQFWIHKLSAIGDSYSAGLGAGSRIDFLCSRYDRSYPAMINNDEWLNQVSNLTFQFLACSGATSGDILSDQVPKLEEGQDAITVSAGGNDIGLSSCLNDCVFGWLPGDPDQCDQTLNETEQLINNDLPGNLDDLLSAVKPKLSKHGRVYYTGYAKFFDDTTRQCDSVSWDVWPQLYRNTNRTRLLTQSRRKRMNNLVNLINQKLQNAVERNLGHQGIFIGYDEYYRVIEGRYCENQVHEPSPLRPLLLFYERGTKDLKYDSDHPGEDTIVVDDSIVADNTFEGQIANWVAQTLSQHPDLDLKSNLEGGQFEAGQAENSMNDDDNATIQSSLTWFFPDSMKRVFHPRPLGHAVIANLVLERMKEEQGRMFRVGNEFGWDEEEEEEGET